MKLETIMAILIIFTAIAAPLVLSIALASVNHEIPQQTAMVQPERIANMNLALPL